MYVSLLWFNIRVLFLLWMSYEIRHIPVSKSRVSPGGMISLFSWDSRLAWEHSQGQHWDLTVFPHRKIPPLSSLWRLRFCLLWEVMRFLSLLIHLSTPQLTIFLNQFHLSSGCRLSSKNKNSSVVHSLYSVQNHNNWSRQYWLHPFSPLLTEPRFCSNIYRPLNSHVPREGDVISKSRITSDWWKLTMVFHASCQLLVYAYIACDLVLANKIWGVGSTPGKDFPYLK